MSFSGHVHTGRPSAGFRHSPSFRALLLRAQLAREQFGALPAHAASADGRPPATTLAGRRTPLAGLRAQRGRALQPQGAACGRVVPASAAARPAGHASGQGRVGTSTPTPTLPTPHDGQFAIHVAGVDQVTSLNLRLKHFDLTKALITKNFCFVLKIHNNSNMISAGAHPGAGQVRAAGHVHTQVG